jgi:very-short-patch-repair endonuclease
VSDENGRVGRIDFAYPTERIAIEVQSYAWHSSRKALTKDAERFNRLQALGWIVILVTYEDLEKHPGRVVARIRSALESRREMTSSP